MSFTQHFNNELLRLGPLFASAENANKDFHRAWKEGIAKLGIGRYKQTEDYGQRLEHYRATRQTIDAVVSAAFTQAKAGDQSQLPTLFAYIALPGRYFRSGYRRADIWRFLKRLSLDEEQSDILRGIVLRQIETAGPEFTEIARTARTVNSAEFRENVRNVMDRYEKDYAFGRAKHLLTVLESIALCTERPTQRKTPGPLR